MVPRQRNYRRLRRRMRKTLAYGKFGNMDQLSAPLSDAAKAYFDRNAPFDYLDEEFAAKLSRDACVSPCSLIVALMYLERVRICDQKYFDTTDPADLYLSALVLACKYLHDDTEREYVYNDEWAASASCTLDHVNQLEMTLLNRLDWNLVLSEESFERTLSELELLVSGRESERRGYCTYTELRILTAQMHLLRDLLLPLIKCATALALTYVCTVAGLICSALALKTASAPSLMNCIQQSTVHDSHMLPSVAIHSATGTSSLLTVIGSAPLCSQPITMPPLDWSWLAHNQSERDASHADQDAFDTLGQFKGNHEQILGLQGSDQTTENEIKLELVGSTEKERGCKSSVGVWFWNPGENLTEV